MGFIHTSKRIISWMSLAIFWFFWVIYAAVNYSELFPNGPAWYYQSQTNGWSTPASTSKDITIWDGSCKRITSTTNTLSFIPTKTQTEWNNFAAHLPSGVSIGSCAVNCSYNTYNGSCNTSCGWGNYYTYYNITVPASGWGTCAVTQGQYAWLGASCYAGACPVNGVCNNSTRGGCSAGTLSWINNTTTCWTTATWTCLWQNGWSNSSTCSYANPVCPVNGVCGSSNGGYFASAPTSGLCSAGNPTAVSGSGPYSWSCTGINGGTTASCSAHRLYTYSYPTYWSRYYALYDTTYPCYIDGRAKYYPDTLAAYYCTNIKGQSFYSRTSTASDYWFVCRIKDTAGFDGDGTDFDNDQVVSQIQCYK